MAISELYTPPSSNFSEQCWVQKCLLNKPYWRSIAKKNLFCTLYRVLKLVVFHSHMNCKCKIFIQNAELLTPVAQNWHNFFRSYEEMAENKRKQQKSMSLPLTSETAVEYTIWPANDAYMSWILCVINFIVGKDNPLKGMQAMVAVSCKLIRIFYALLTHG